MLEDMLCPCIIDFGGSWDSYLALAEFSYNNIHHASIGMPPLRIYIEGDVRLLFVGGEVGQRVMGSTEVVLKTTEIIGKVRQRLLTAQICLKSYTDRRRSKIEF